MLAKHLKSLSWNSKIHFSSPVHRTLLADPFRPFTVLEIQRSAQHLKFPLGLSIPNYDNPVEESMQVLPHDYSRRVLAR